jgi:hypothetical protein
MRRGLQRLIAISYTLSLFMSPFAVAQQGQSFLPDNLQWQVGQQSPFGLSQNRSGTNITQPQSRTSNNQQNSNSNPSLFNNQPASPGHAQGTQPASQNVDYQRESNKIQRCLADLTKWLVVVGAIQVGIIFFQIFIGLKAADAAKESADTARESWELGNRAHLTFERWKFEIPMPYSKDHPPTRIVYRLRNVGYTPATLISSYSEYSLEGVTVASDYRERALMDVLNFAVLSQRAEPMAIQRISVQEAQRMFVGVPNRENRRVTEYKKDKLYVFVYVKYEDVFGEEHETASLLGYNLEVRRFEVIPAPDYNYAT